MNRSPFARDPQALPRVPSTDAQRPGARGRRPADLEGCDAGSDVRRSLRNVASSFQRVAARMRALVVPGAPENGPDDESDPLAGYTAAGTWGGPVHRRRFVVLK